MKPTAVAISSIRGPLDPTEFYENRLSSFCVIIIIIITIIILFSYMMKATDCICKQY